MNKIIYTNRNNLYIANRYNVFRIKSFLNKINLEKINNFFNIEHKGWNQKYNTISMYNFINLITPIIYKKQINYKNKKLCNEILLNKKLFAFQFLDKEKEMNIIKQTIELYRKNTNDKVILYKNKTYINFFVKPNIL